MPVVNNQYAMNPQLAQAKGDQAAQEADTRTSAELASYMELPGAQKDADCTVVNVPGGVSSAGGCCNLWQAGPNPTAFSCGTCTKLKPGAAVAPGADDSAGGGDDGSVSQPSSSASPQSPS